MIIMTNDNLDHECSKCFRRETGNYFLFIGNWKMCEPCLDSHARKKYYRSISRDNEIVEALEDSE